MKVAVLILGEFREFDIAVESWSFKNYDHIDYQISSWNTSNQGGINENVTEESFTKHLSNVEHIKIWEKTQYYTDTAVDYLTDTTQAFRFHFMYMYEELIQPKNKKYDYIFITRPDLWYATDSKILSIPFFKQIEDDTIYTLGPLEPPTNESQGFVNDILFYGKSKEMIEFLNLVQYQPINHQHAAKAIHENFKHKESTIRGVNIVRPNVRNVDDKSLLNIKTIRRLDDEFCEYKEKRWNNK
tara:strand:- start:131 stop:856 length:726 start_codon:yes stop_codon:yes gene_type:complete